jgi:hypothetical protein
MTVPAAQLLVYSFAPGASFDGGLVGALERLESGGALRILGALFVQRDTETDEIVAIDLRGRGAGSAVGPLLGFRLDPSERRRATEKALRDESGGLPGATVRELAAALPPGGAVAAVLVEHVWAGALLDAAERSGGTAVANDLVDATSLADVTPALLAAARRRTEVAG